MATSKVDENKKKRQVSTEVLFKKKQEKEADNVKTKRIDGNIDLFSRPKVDNGDGTYSTVRSITVSEGKDKTVVIPTVIKKNGEWQVVSNEEAIAHYKKSGEFLRAYEGKQSKAKAEKYSGALHEQQAKYYDDK